MTGSIFLETGEYSVAETDGFVRITIRRTGDTSGAVELEYGINADTARAGEDYQASGQFITIEAGEDRVTFDIPILDDGTSEPTETFNVSLVNVDSGQLQFPRTARIDILDDENPVTDPGEPPLVSNFEVTQEALASGLDRPVALEFVPGQSDKIAVVGQNGIVRLFDSDTASFQSEAFLDIREKVNVAGDRGMMDLEFHPDFANNPYVYVFYVVDPPESAGASGAARRDGDGNRFAYVSRFTVEDDNGTLRAIENSEVVIAGADGQSLSDISGNGAVNGTATENAGLLASDIDPVTGAYKQDYIKVDAVSHMGGSLDFGPDGALYVGTGDGTSFNFADPRTVSVQSVDALAGKILRIDPLTGNGFADNPFASEAGGDLSANAAKVFQLGLRHPFSMGFDDDGQLFIADTGWFSYEEINLGGPGANFGWPFFEGGDNGELVRTPQYADLPEAQGFYAAVESGQIEITAPYRGFSHADAAPGFQVQTIVGADGVYSGDVYPEELRDHYFFTDISQGEVYAVSANDRRDVKYLTTESDGFGPAHIKQGPDGFLYYADVITGEIGRYRITENGNPDPDPDPNPGRRVIDDPTQNEIQDNTGDTFVIARSAEDFGVNRTEDGNGVVVYTNDTSDNVYDILLGFDTVEFSDRSLDINAFVQNGPVYQDIPDFTQILTGNTSNDRFAIDASSNAFGIGETENGNGAVVFTTAPGDDVYDILFGFEFIDFNDGSIDLNNPGTSPVRNRVNDDPAVNEILTGTSGVDVFVINGSISDFQANQTENGLGVVVWTNAPGDNIYDILFDYEFIEFNDGEIAAADLLSPDPVVADNPAVTQILTGTGPDDRFVIDALASAYEVGITESGTGVVVYTSAPGDSVYDILFGFDAIQFNDQTIELGSDGLLL